MVFSKGLFPRAQGTTLLPHSKGRAFPSTTCTLCGNSEDSLGRAGRLCTKLQEKGFISFFLGLFLCYRNCSFRGCNMRSHAWTSPCRPLLSCRIQSGQTPTNLSVLDTRDLNQKEVGKWPSNIQPVPSPKHLHPHQKGLSGNLYSSFQYHEHYFSRFLMLSIC